MTRMRTRIKPLGQALSLVASAALVFGMTPGTALAAPDPTKEVVSVETLKGAKTADELTQNILSGEGVAVDDDDFTSATSTRKSANVVRLANGERPAVYDLRNVDRNGDGEPESYVTSVKMQSPFGTCWAFGAIGAAEVSLLAEYGMPATPGNDPVNLSEKHLAWFGKTALPEDGETDQGGEGLYQAIDDIYYKISGGNSYLSTTLFSTNTGPVDESFDPLLEYHNAENQWDPLTMQHGFPQPEGYIQPSLGGDWSIPERLRNVFMNELEGSYYLPSPASYEATDNPAIGRYVFNQEGLDAIKDQLLAGRGVTISYHADTAMPSEVGDGKYLNWNTFAHYTYESMEEGVPSAAPNHAVCIVGYDDTYSKENFNAPNLPPEDGAFIVMNSWGSKDSAKGNQSLWGIDDSGYFYLSYYDKTLNTAEAYDFITPNDTDLSYGTQPDAYEIEQYQHSYLAMVPMSDRYNGVSSMANVYEIDEPSVIRAVSTQTYSFDAHVRFDVYKMNEGATVPSDGTLAWSHDETYQYGGLHRAELESPLVVNPGDRVAVVCTTSLPNGTYEVINNRFYSEMAAKAATPNPQEQNWAEAVVNPGESFLGSPAKRIEYSDGSYAYDDYAWTDFSDVLAEGRKMGQTIVDEIGLADLVTARDAAYAKLQATSPDDPGFADAQAASSKAQQELDAALSATETSQANYLYMVQDNFPLNMTAEVVDPDDPPTARTVDLLRLYNPNTGEHLYTSDAGEKAALVAAGWNDEGLGWSAPAVSNVPVCRLFNKNSGEHLYTSSANERDVLASAGWSDEGVGFYSDFRHSDPVYRLYNPGNPEISSHLFTTDASERDALVKGGWRPEGIAWYAV